MTAIVRIATYSALITAPVSPGSARFTSDSVGMFKLPFMGNEKLTCGIASVASSDADIAPRGATMVQVQIQSGKLVHYAVTPLGRDLVEPDDTYPVISGEAVLQFGEGWRISFLENNDA